MVADPVHVPSAPARLVSFDGLTLAIQRRRGQRSPPLLFAHGFGQTHHAWNGAAEALAAQGFDVTTFDARGHGESERMPRGDYHMEQFVADLLAVGREARSPDGRPPVLVGASLGGLLGLVAAGEADEGKVPFSALILVDITPRWETAGVERILGFMRAHPRGFASYDEAASAIEAYLPHRERKTEAQLKPLLRQDDDGRLRWHWDPALLDGLVQESERYQPRLFAAAARVTVPVLLLSGTRSDVVSSHTVDEFLRLVPHARHVALADATHMVAGDANDAFTREIASFMNTLANPTVTR